MGMHQGLDLSRFKKVSSDKTTTTLRHSKGHEIRVAHSGLTPKMREALDALECHDVKKYAEGTPDEPVTAQPMDPASPAPVSAPQSPVPTDQLPMAAPHPKPDTMPVAGEINVVGEKPPVFQPIDPNHLKMENAAWDQDLKNGHVTPETYHDLFAKKDTLGKIGTLFGLLVSGAGAGLTHQPNAVMQMMDQEIGRDLEAQKQSKGNAQNFLELNRKMHLDEGQIAKWQSDGQVNEAQANLMRKDADTKAYTLGRMQANSAALHNLVLKVNKLPVGSPERMKAEQALALLTQGIQTENYSLADRAAAASALGAMAFGQPGQPPAEGGDKEGDFQQGQGVLRMSGNAPMAEDRASRHMPGVEGAASVPLSGGDREQINSGITFQKQLGRFIDWTKKHSGDISPSERNEGEALAAQIQGAYRQATNGGVYKEGEQGFISSIIDSTPTKFFNSIRVIPQLTAVQKESGSQLDQLLKSKGFKGYSRYKEGDKMRNKEGSEVVYKGGKWVPSGKAEAKK